MCVFRWIWSCSWCPRCYTLFFVTVMLRKVRFLSHVSCISLLNNVALHIAVTSFVCHVMLMLACIVNIQVIMILLPGERVAFCYCSFLMSLTRAGGAPSQHHSGPHELMCKIWGLTCCLPCRTCAVSLIPLTLLVLLSLFSRGERMRQRKCQTLWGVYTGRSQMWMV